MTSNERNDTYLSPETMPTTLVSRLVYFPDDVRVWGAIREVIGYLAVGGTWESTPAVDERYMQAFMSDILRQLLVNPLIGWIVPNALSYVPSNMLPCDGSLHERADYPELYAVLNPIFHENEAQFRTPDLRGKTVIGAGGDYETGVQVGQSEVVLTVDEIPSHAHEMNPHAHTTAPHNHTQAQHSHTVPMGNTAGSGAAVVRSANVTTAIATDSATPAINNANVTVNSTTSSMKNAGGGLAHNNMQPSYALPLCIVAR